jgi:predicted AAA+ superfamily ATPase
LKSFKKLKVFRKIILSYMTNFINYSEIWKKVWIDYNTVLNWINYFEQAYFLYELKNFDFSVWKQETSISKIYILDNSYYSLNFINYKEDYWILFENFVFMEFRKLWLIENKNIFYFKNKNFDIDFVIFENNETKFIQVVYELNKDNYKREVEQLQEAQKKFNKKWYLIYYENIIDFEIVDIELIKFDKIKNIINNEKNIKK